MKMKNLAIILTSFFVYLLIGCKTQTEQHTHYYISKRDDDFHWKECSCGNIKDKNEHDHSTLDSVLKDATCTEEGIYEYKCSCGSKVEKTIPMTEHDYSILVTNETNHWYECECGMQSEKIEHDYSAKTVITKDPTCTENGIKQLYCGCGEYIEEEYGSASGHNYAKWKEIKAPTIDETGLIERTCSVDSSHKEQMVLPKLNDVDYQHTVDTAQTCTKKGKDKYSIKINDQEFSYYHTLDVLEHTLKEEIQYNDQKHYDYCTSCKSKISEEAHTYDENQVCRKCGYANHFKYNVYNNKAYVNGLVTDTGDLIVHEKYQGYNVESISDIGTSEKCVNIYIPKTIKSISASFETYSYLTNVYYYGTIEDWCNISFSKATSNPMCVAENFYILDSNNKFVKLENIVINNDVESINKYAFYNFVNIESVKIEGGVTKIFNNAFENCTKLQSVVATDRIGEILKDAFKGCQSLTTISEVGIVGESAFEGSLSLTEITISDTKISKNAFKNCTKLETVTFKEGVVIIEESAFEGCSSLVNIVIPSTVTSIEKNAFRGCEKIEKIELAEGVSELGESAFENCYALTNINIPESVVTLSKYVFRNCKTLDNVVLPNTLLTISEGLFEGCSSLKNIEFSSEVKSIGVGAFKLCSSLTEFELPAALTSISESLFEGCSKLKSLTISENIESIGDYAFKGCNGFTSFVIPDTVKSIGACIFNNCGSLKNIVIPFVGQTLENPENYRIGHIFYFSNTSSIPYNVRQIVITKRISEEAFYECSSIKKIIYADDITNLTVPSTGLVLVIKTGISELEDSAFKECTSLTEVHLSETITTIGKETFKDCTALKTINIPESILIIKTDAFSNCNLIEYTEYNNGYYFGNENNNYLVFVGFIDTPTSLTFHPNTKIILAKALVKYTKISTIVIQEGITYIGANNFSSRDLVNKLVLPSTIVGIGEGCFDLAIEYLYYDGTIETWCNISFEDMLSNPIGYEGFYMLDSNGKISYSGKKYTEFTDITIPNTITKIGDHQFFGYDALENIIIPESVTSIGFGAFRSCSSLKIVKIEGEGLISVEEYAFEYCTALDEINFPNSVESIGFAAFNLCDDYNSFNYFSLPFIGERADGNGETHFGYIFGAEDYTQHDFKVPSIAVLEITGDSKGFGIYSFIDCNIGTLICSGNIEQIGAYAFLDSGINTIVLPNTIKTISSSAFYTRRYAWGSYIYEEYVSIENLYYNGSVEDYINLNFNYSLRLGGFKNIYVLSDDGEEEYMSKKYSIIRDLIISDEIKEISSYRFHSWRSVNKIYIPVSVKTFDSNAFYNFSSLNAIYYGGTLEDWCKIRFYENGNPLIQASYLYILDENGTVEYNGQKFSEVQEIIIPESITAIGQYQFEGISYQDNVVIHDNVKTIGFGAFKDVSIKNMKIPFVGKSIDATENYFGYIFGADKTENNTKYVYVRNVEFSNKMTEIPSNSFYGCDYIGTIIMPKSITKIGEDAFNCEIEYFYYGGTLEDWCNVTLGSIASSPIGSKKFYVIDPDSTSDDNYISLENITLDGTISVINDYTFAKHKSLKNLVILEGVTEIGKYAFYNCTSLINIDFSDSLQTISSYAFKGCNNLTFVEIKGGTQTIEAGAFQGCTSLEELVLPFVGNSRDVKNGPSNVLGYIFGLKTSRAYSWSSYSSSDYENPSSASETLNGYLLQYSCPNYKVEDSNGEVHYELTVYYYDLPTSLRKVTITDQNEIGDASFRGCYFLEEINFNREITRIGEYAFYKCSGLTSFTVSPTVTSIGYNAFGKCDNLEKIELPFIGEKISEEKNSNFGYIFGGYEVEKQNESIPSKLIEVIVNNGKVIHSKAFINCTNLKTIILPEGLEKIESYAFSNCTGLETISIPKSVTYIGLGALSGCSFKELELPFIGESKDGTGATHFGYIFGAEVYEENASYVPGKLEKLIVNTCTYIKENDFYGCSNIGDITIKKGIVTIEKNAFKNFTNLIRFDAYEGVGKVEEYAFGGCTNLEFIRVSSKAVMIENYAFTKCSKLVINCYFDEQYASNFESSWSVGAKHVEYNVIKKVLGIDLNTYFKSILVGNTYQLVVSSIPSDIVLNNVVWTTSNPEVATVNDKGLVTAISLGQTKVTATYGDYSETCIIKVTEKQTITCDMGLYFGTFASEWEKSYQYRKIEGKDVGLTNDIISSIEFSRVSKQYDTLPTIASNGSEVYVTLNSNNVIKKATFELDEWATSKKFTTVQIEYKTLDGEWITIGSSGYSGSSGLSISSIGETISAEIPEESYAVRLKVISIASTSNQQIYIESIQVEVN